MDGQLIMKTSNITSLKNLCVYSTKGTEFNQVNSYGTCNCASMDNFHDSVMF